GNVISGNGQDGVGIFFPGSTGNLVAGNYIGTDATGSIALGNVADGVRLGSAGTGNVIGTDGTNGAGNVISRNAGSGVDIIGTNFTVVGGNFIGTDVTGSTALGNGPGALVSGVSVQGGSQHNLIGGNLASTRNVISGNNGFGVHLFGFGTQDNRVQ